jgi:hypothetical protein
MWGMRREVTQPGALEKLCDASEAMTRGSLILAGYYRHHRGEWRKRDAKIDSSAD